MKVPVRYETVSNNQPTKNNNDKNERKFFCFFVFNPIIRLRRRCARTHSLTHSLSLSLSLSLTHTHTHTASHNTRWTCLSLAGRVTKKQTNKLWVNSKQNETQTFPCLTTVGSLSPGPHGTLSRLLWNCRPWHCPFSSMEPNASEQARETLNTTHTAITVSFDHHYH